MLELRRAFVQECKIIDKLQKKLLSSPWTYKALKDCFKYKNDVFVLVEDSLFIGFIVFAKVGFDYHLFNLGVAKNQQKKGYAFKLLNFMLVKAKSEKIENIFLEVRANNLAAINLYHKLGFNEIGERKNYYPKDKICQDAKIFARIIL